MFTWSFWAFDDIPGLGKYGFSCSQAHDSVRRDSLKLRLEQLGIKGNFLDIITSIYKFRTVSTPFSTSVGLRQGDIF